MPLSPGFVLKSIPMASLRNPTAKAIPVPKEELRGAAKLAYDRWMDRINAIKRNPNKNPDDFTLRYWSAWSVLTTEKTVAHLSVKPIGFKHNMSFPLAIEGDIPKHTRPGRYYLAGGEMVRRQNPVTGMMVPIKMTIKFSGVPSLEEFRNNRAAVEKEIFSVLIHEFTHAADYGKGKGWGTSTSENQTNSSYHNDPREVRAFLQQILEETEEYIRKFVGDDTFGLSDQVTDLINLALKESFTWKRIEPDLTPENRKYILRNVGQFVIRLIDKLYEELGSPVNL